MRRWFLTLLLLLAPAAALGLACLAGQPPQWQVPALVALIAALPLALPWTGGGATAAAPRRMRIELAFLQGSELLTQRCIECGPQARGDTFAGAFACLVSENAPLEKALEVGCEAAALKCLKPGAQDGMPVRGEVKALGARQSSWSR